MPDWKVTKSMLAEPLTTREKSKPALANLDNKFVFIISGTFRTKSSTDFYNIANDEWTKGPLMTAPRYNESACIRSGILYAIGGVTPD